MPNIQRAWAGALATTALVATVLIAPSSAAIAGDRVISDVEFASADLAGWVPTGSSASVSVVDLDGQSVLEVAGRASDWSGIQSPAMFEPGRTYELSLRLRLADGVPNSRARFVMRPDFVWVGDTAVTSTGWTTVSGTYTVPVDAEAETVSAYIGTADIGEDYTYFVDDVRVTTAASIRQGAPLPVGVAIDQRETSGAAAGLIVEDFDQITAENHMKPDAWYAADRSFRMHPQATELMDFAESNGLRVYGHTLAWHSQTPGWFFDAVDGSDLTSAEPDRAILRARLRDHIFGVAASLSDTGGPFGGGNPVAAFDVVNEVISDSGEFADGLRRSDWYRVLGESFIDLAFSYADEAFNDVYAAEGSDRPVKLFINDYGTEWDGKRDRYHALVERLLSRGVPVDGVGHQFHVSLSLPVETLSETLSDFDDLPVTQAVTEFDVPTGTPVTSTNLGAQADYYGAAFQAFYEHEPQLFSVTVWGLTDGRSWRAGEGAPLLFDDDLVAKPAYASVLDAAPASPEAVAVTARVALRCAADRAYVVATVTNSESVGLSLAVHSAYGSRQVQQIAAGQSRSWVLPTRQSEVPASALTVEATAADGRQRVLDAAYDAHRCP